MSAHSSGIAHLPVYQLEDGRYCDFLRWYCESVGSDTQRGDLDAHKCTLRGRGAVGGQHFAGLVTGSGTGRAQG